MTMLWRVSRWLVAMAMAFSAGILPSCASMGGGGMRYDTLFITSPAEASVSS
jgi:hypothetical protein